MTLAPPNGELVTQAWLAKYAGIPAGLISSKLPKIDPKSETNWTAFFTVRALPAGSANPDLVERRSSVLQVDAWGRAPQSPKPPWNAMMAVLERVRLATRRDAQTFGRPLEMPVSGYQTARVLVAYLTSEPIRVEGDPSGFAHMTCDLAVDWTV